MKTPLMLPSTFNRVTGRAENGGVKMSRSEAVGRNACASSGVMMGSLEKVVNLRFAGTEARTYQSSWVF